MGKETFVAIMAGGIGSRFWPMSRKQRPKQFLDLLGIGKSLLQMTYDRFAAHYKEENILIVTSKDYVDEIKQQLPQLTNGQIITEPQRKNTAPCILHTALQIQEWMPDAHMVVTPADHFILEQDQFLATIDQGLDFIGQKSNALLTLGVQPTKPHTGYGYIQFDESDEAVKPVKTFTEKPTLAFAKRFLASGDFLWNSGIFIWSVETILHAFRWHLSDMYDLFQEIDYSADNAQFEQQVQQAYSRTQNISIDYGILEKSDQVYVLPAYFSWSDLGTWDALYEQRAEKKGDNVVQADISLIRNSSNNMVYIEPEDKLVVLQDVDNLIVVDKGDTLVIANKDSEQKLKDVVRELGSEGLQEYL